MVDSNTQVPQLSVIEALDKLKLAVLDGGTPDNISFDFQRCKDYVIQCAENAPKNFELGLASRCPRRPKRQKIEISDAELSVVAGR